MGIAMSSEDADYYRQRAQAEREQARSAANANVAEIHDELARLYEALIEHEVLRPTRRKLSLVYPSSVQI